MADEKPIELSQENPNAEKHNLEVAAQLAAQDASGKSLAPEITAETSDALDALRAEKQNKADEPEAVIEPAKPAEKAADKDADVSDDKSADKPAEKPVEKPAETPAADIFAGIELPPKASPKSGEAFAAVKLKAAQEITTRDQEIATLKKSLAEAEEKLKQPIPAELEKELADHRTFRAKLDVEADPKFKEYDKQIAGVHDFVYAQLLKTGKIGQEHIDLIKKYGGPEQVNLEKIFEVVADPTVRRIVESKVADVEMLKHQKETAIKQTRENITGYLKEQEETFSKAMTAHNDATKEQLTTMLTRLDWMKPKEVKADADEAAKAGAKEHADFIAATKADMEAALSDDSPQMRAILIAGMAQLLNTKRTVKSLTSEREALNKQVDELTKKVERLTSASVSRIRDSAAPTTGVKPEKKEPDLQQPTGDALDAARDKILEERRAKSI